jgi:hypothetical protein
VTSKPCVFSLGVTPLAGTWQQVVPARRDVLAPSSSRCLALDVFQGSRHEPGPSPQATGARGREGPGNITPLCSVMSGGGGGGGGGSLGSHHHNDLWVAQAFNRARDNLAARPVGRASNKLPMLDVGRRSWAGRSLVCGRASGRYMPEQRSSRRTKKHPGHGTSNGSESPPGACCDGLILSWPRRCRRIRAPW